MRPAHICPPDFPSVSEVILYRCPVPLFTAEPPYSGHTPNYRCLSGICRRRFREAFNSIWIFVPPSAFETTQAHSGWQYSRRKSRRILSLTGRKATARKDLPNAIAASPIRASNHARHDRSVDPGEGVKSAPRAPESASLPGCESGRRSGRRRPGPTSRSISVQMHRPFRGRFARTGARGRFAPAYPAIPACEKGAANATPATRTMEYRGRRPRAPARESGRKPEDTRHS
jgi:hypothetical protein